MDPDSGPRNTKIISFIPENIEQEYISFDEVNDEKIFKIAYLNDCDLGLVTCMAKFDNNYNLLSCYIDIELLGEKYKTIKERQNSLSLNDLFVLADKYRNCEKLTLTFDGNKCLSYMIGEKYKTKTSPYWIASFALKEEENKYMDMSDKMIDYLCTKLDSKKRYKNIFPFKRVESIFRAKNISSKKLMKKIV